MTFKQLIEVSWKKPLQNITDRFKEITIDNDVSHADNCEAEEEK